MKIELDQGYQFGLGAFETIALEHGKPVFLKRHLNRLAKAAEFLKLPASECLVVEDAEAGLLAAKNGGMDSAAIGDAVKSDLPQYKLETFSDLLNI